MTEKLTTAQTAVLDKVALHGSVTGVPVLKAGLPPHYASLRSCQSLVAKGYLKVVDPGFPYVFELDEADVEPVAASPEEYAGLVEKLGLDAATRRSRAMLIVLNNKGPVFAGVPAHVKSTRRRKGKVAKASRKVNRP